MNKTFKFGLTLTLTVIGLNIIAPIKSDSQILLIIATIMLMTGLACMLEGGLRDDK
jgi:hypothetical protein